MLLNLNSIVLEPLRSEQAKEHRLKLIEACSEFVKIAERNRIASPNIESASKERSTYFDSPRKHLSSLERFEYLLESKALSP